MIFVKKKQIECKIRTPTKNMGENYIFFTHPGINNDTSQHDVCQKVDSQHDEPCIVIID